MVKKQNKKQNKKSIWSLNVNLFFKGPQQLTEFTWWVHLNKVW